MSSTSWARLLALSAVASLSCGGPAQAAAWAGVDYSYFRIYLDEKNPPEVLDNVTISWGDDFIINKSTSVSGDGSASGDIVCGSDGVSVGCTGNASASAEKNGSATINVEVYGTIFITNTSSEEIPSTEDSSYILIDSDFSAFDPGGSGIGAIVDDVETEDAGFSSSESDDIGLVSDLHGCNTYSIYSSGYGGTTNGGLGAFCGVNAPDSSEVYREIGSIPANTTVELDAVMFQIDATASASTPPAVPEPVSTSLFVMALAGLASVRLGRCKRSGQRLDCATRCPDA